MPEYRLMHDVASAAHARSLAREAVGSHLVPERLDAFLLMTSELVANAVRHAPPEADGKIALRVDVSDQVVRAVVMDGGTEFEFERATFDARSRHFGLQLVDRLADRWGLSLDGEKAVWFEIDR